MYLNYVKMCKHPCKTIIFYLFQCKLITVYTIYTLHIRHFLPFVCPSRLGTRVTHRRHRWFSTILYRIYTLDEGWRMSHLSSYIDYIIKLSIRYNIYIIVGYTYIISSKSRQKYVLCQIMSNNIYLVGYLAFYRS